MATCRRCIEVDGVCEVCKVLNNDVSIKKVSYCETCNVYICKAHHRDWGARIRAAYLKKLHEIEIKTKRILGRKNKK